MNFSMRGRSQVTLLALRSLVDAMNSYFCSVGKDLADKISPVPNTLLSGDFEMNKTKAKFHFRTIEVQESEMRLPRLKQ